MGTTFNSDFRATPGVERKQDNAYYQSIFAGCNMPFAFVDLDLLEQNIRQVLASVGENRCGSHPNHCAVLR